MQSYEIETLIEWLTNDSKTLFSDPRRLHIFSEGGNEPQLQMT